MLRRAREDLRERAKRGGEGVDVVDGRRKKRRLSSDPTPQIGSFEGTLPYWPCMALPSGLRRVAAVSFAAVAGGVDAADVHVKQAAGRVTS